jgi:hypothetical protein
MRPGATSGAFYFQLANLAELGIPATLELGPRLAGWAKELRLTPRSCSLAETALAINGFARIGDQRGEVWCAVERDGDRGHRLANYAR